MTSHERIVWLVHGEIVSGCGQKSENTKKKEKRFAAYVGAAEMIRWCLCKKKAPKSDFLCLFYIFFSLSNLQMWNCFFFGLLRMSFKKFEIKMTELMMSSSLNVAFIDNKNDS